MGYYVPYKGVSLANPISIVYVHNCFSVVCEDVHHVQWHSDFIPMSLSPVTDISRINEQIKKFIESTPSSIIFSNEDAYEFIPNWEDLVCTHIANWIRTYNVNPKDIALFLDYKREQYNRELDASKASGDTIVRFTSNEYSTTDYTTLFSTSGTSTTNSFTYKIQPSIPVVSLKIPMTESFTLDDDSLMLTVNSFDDFIFPVLAIMSHIACDAFFMKDYINMSSDQKTYFQYLINKIISSVNQYQREVSLNSTLNDISKVHGVDISQLILDETIGRVSSEYNTSRDVIDYIIRNSLDVWKYISTQSEHKILYKYPLTGICNIPAISAYPQTAFQWMLTNDASKKEFDLMKSLVKQEFHSVFISNERDNTQKLLPYIHASDKALEMYLRYTNSLDENGNYHTRGIISTYDNSPISVGKLSIQIPHGMNENTLKSICTSLMNFINDGIQLEKTYPDPIEIEEYGTIRMAPVKGSILKMVRNSIFNHRMEAKISLEHKLNALLGETTEEENRMTCEYELPAELEQYRIKRKSDMIGIGKILGHCIGNYTNSKDLFFRNNTVCAQLSTSTWTINQCYDAHNKHTDASTAFKSWLENAIVMYMASTIDPAILMRLLNIPESTYEEFDLKEHTESIQTNHGQIRSMFITSNTTHEDRSAILAGINNQIVARDGYAIVGGRDHALYLNDAVGVANA